MSKKRFINSLLLYSEFPLAFSVSSPKPLKIGIHIDIAEHFRGEFSAEDITKALTAYTNRKKYQHSILRNKDRFDLNGLVSGSVTAGDRHFASRNLYIAMLNSPEGRQIKQERAKRNKALLLQYEAANALKKVGIYEFAASIGLKDGTCESMIYWAKKDRADRLTKRLELVASFNESGLAAPEFCATYSIKPEKLEHALKKVAEHLERVATNPDKL